MTLTSLQLQWFQAASRECGLTELFNLLRVWSRAVIVNNEPGLDHLPGPDAHDIQYSVSAIPQVCAHVCVHV